jgi:hypothetical protein
MLMAALDDAGDEDLEEKMKLFDVERAIKVGIEGVKILIEQDRAASA